MGCVKGIEREGVGEREFPVRGDLADARARGRKPYRAQSELAEDEQ